MEGCIGCSLQPESEHHHHHRNQTIGRPEAGYRISNLDRENGREAGPRLGIAESESYPKGGGSVAPAPPPLPCNRIVLLVSARERTGPLTRAS